MLNRLTSTVFKAIVVLVALATAVWLTITGHTLVPGGLLVALGALLAAVIFGFLLAEGLGPDRLSIWAGPLRSMRQAAPALGDRDALREAA